MAAVSVVTSRSDVSRAANEIQPVMSFAINEEEQSYINSILIFKLQLNDFEYHPFVIFSFQLRNLETILIRIVTALSIAWNANVM